MRNSADPVTLTVIQSGIRAAAREMFETLRKTAMSPIIYEVLDVGTGVTDAAGNLADSGAGIPTFVGVIDKAVRRIIELAGNESIVEGDVFVTNDPNFGGVTHLNDVVLAMPVFHAGERIAWAASIGHWSDVGGMTPGSMSTDAVDIHQEGLRLPAVRLFEAGRRVDPVFDIIRANCRVPEIALGDLWAQVSAARRAGRRLERLAERFGVGAFRAAISDLFEEGELRALRGLASLPSGTYGITEEQDDGALWNAEIRISQDKFEVDLRDNPEQRASPYNTSRDGAVISAQMIFKALTDPDRFANAGSFRPLHVITRPVVGVSCQRNRPTRVLFRDSHPAVRHALALHGKRLSGAAPGRQLRFDLRVPCSSARTRTPAGLSQMVEPQMGGWGATSQRDGLDCMYSASHGETFNCPVEISEARYGLEVLWRKLGVQGGPGLHRGGRGMSTSYRMRAPAVLAAGYSCYRKRVWGLRGGSAGGNNRLTVVRQGKRRESHAFVSDLTLQAGEEILIETASGGSWGGAGLIGVACRARGFVHLITAVLVANWCRSYYTRGAMMERRSARERLAEGAQRAFVLDKDMGAPMMSDAARFAATDSEGRAVVPLTAAQKYHFDTKGWLAIPGVLEAAEIEEMREFVLRLAEEPESIPEQQRSPVGGPLQRLTDHPVVIGFAQEFIYRPFTDGGGGSLENDAGYGFRQEHSFVTVRRARRRPPRRPG